MPDTNHLWGEDLTISASGDIAIVDGDAMTTQRILRRLMTAQGDYIWNLNYGGGVPRRVGNVADIPLINSVIRSQVALEAAVARTPAPVITVTPILNGVSVYIKFWSASTGQEKTLSFNINE